MKKLTSTPIRKYAKCDACEHVYDKSKERETTFFRNCGVDMSLQLCNRCASCIPSDICSNDDYCYVCGIEKIEKSGQQVLKSKSTRDDFFVIMK